MAIFFRTSWRAGWALGLAGALALGCAKRPDHAVTTPPPTESVAPPVETAEPPVETAEPPAETAEPLVATVEPPVESAEPPAEPAPIEARPVEAAKPEPEPIGGIGGGRDRRVFASRQRPRDMLIAEIHALERLYAATAKQAPDRPRLLRRLAESYVELEYAARNFNDSTGPKVKVAARKKAIEHYRRLRDEYPTDPKLDEVLYYLGYEYEKAGDLANARAMYRQLEREFPRSAYVPRLPRSLLSR